MKIKFYSVFIIAAMLMANGCKKSSDDSSSSSNNNNNNNPPPLTTTDVLTDFANVLARPNYAAFYTEANLLNQAAIKLKDSTTAANLATAQDAWRISRVQWELAEGYLFGPIEDFNYDPILDTWPVNTAELDSLLSSTTPLSVGYIDSLPYSLKGFHPIEYLLFGVGGNKTAAQFTPRQFDYLLALSQSLFNTAIALKNSWDINQPGNFTTQLITAGSGSIRFSTRKDALLAIVTSMEKICNEVANNKMEVPLAAHDSTLTESQYAHNATYDFKNNITGVQNAYMCKFTSTGRSLHSLVAAKDLQLDNAIQQQLNAAISSINAIDPDYGLAIFTQQSQIIMAQSAINDLGNMLVLLHNFIETKITD